jgi:hypothetical protein
MDEQILRVMYGDMAGTRIVEVRIHSRSVKSRSITFYINEFRVWRELLLSPSSEITLRYYRGPEQKLAGHAEDTRRRYERPPARSQPQPRDVRRSFELSEQVIGKMRKHIRATCA